MTGGRGAFSIKLETYAEVPAHLAQKIVEERRAAKAAS